MYVIDKFDRLKIMHTRVRLFYSIINVDDASSDSNCLHILSSLHMITKYTTNIHYIIMTEQVL